MKILGAILFSFTVLPLMAQTDQREIPENAKRYSTETHLNYWNGISATSIGPTVMSGRVVDIEVDPTDPTHFYAAFATGGLWETKNNGTSFVSIFNNQPTFGIGDIAVDWKNNKIYVGTGENNSSRSSYAGMGVFVTDNNGKTWTNLGLKETHHIGRIVLNEQNSDELLVSAIGHLFSYNQERGVYKTTDGGKTWKQTLFVNEKTGVIDLVADPQNAKTLYAAAWQRERQAWNFEESGEGSGIYKSTDGGETWKLISGASSNFPQGKGVGRIGLAVSYQNSNVVYAFLDNQDHRQNEGKGPEQKKGDLTKEELRKMSKEELIKVAPEKIETYLRKNDFPEKYTGEKVLNLVKQNMIQPIALVEYLEDANTLLFDTPVKGAELYRSEDGGLTWKKTHEGYLESMVFTYGYYFGQVRVHPNNHDKVYIAAFLVAHSTNGGKTFNNINGSNVHVDHHALWINPKKEGHLINGNDGGINITYDEGNTWIKCNNIPVGQFYTVAVDNAQNYNVYGGLQDNGVWWGNHKYTTGDGWMMDGKNPYQNVLGGDGMQVQIDTRDNNTLYTGYQFGNYFRINKSTGETKYITPKHELGERPLRYNWQAPIHLSTHQKDVLYIGANKVYRSFDQGNTFNCISPDLTTGGKKGDVAYSTITALHESPMRFGLLYAGTDDGLVHVSKDGGANWSNISKGLPQSYWIRRVVASAHIEGRVYVCLSGHTMDDFSSLLFVSNDYGQNWKQLSNGLSNYPVNVIREDSVSRNLLYVGTDNGLYISVNEGDYFFPVKNNFPVVPVHDLAIQNREADLVVATHGQSIFVVELEQLQQLALQTHPISFTLLPINKVTGQANWGEEEKWYEAVHNSPETKLYYYHEGNEAEVMFNVLDNDGDVLAEKKVKLKKGLQAVVLEMTIEQKTAYAINSKRKKNKQPEKLVVAKNGKFYLKPGKYRIQVTVGAKTYEEILEVVA